MKLTVFCVSVCALGLFLSACGDDAAARVTVHVPGEYSSITEAVRNVRGPMTVLLRAQTYSLAETGELFPINVPDDFVLTGAQAEGDVIIDGGGAGPVFVVDGTRNVSLSDFVIQNAVVSEAAAAGAHDDALAFIPPLETTPQDGEVGGAIHLKGALNAHIHNIEIAHCRVARGAGALYIENSRPVRINNVLIHNSGGLLMDEDTADNGDPAAAVIFAVAFAAAEEEAEAEEVEDAGVPAIAVVDSDVALINNAIADVGANGIHILGNANAELRNNIIAFGGDEETPAVGILNTSSGATQIYYNIIFGFEAAVYQVNDRVYDVAQLNALDDCGHNIGADPLFEDRPQGAYRIQVASPAYEGGDPSSKAYPNPDGTRNHIGYQGGPEAKDY